jgi:hypothetical protein
MNDMDTCPTDTMTAYYRDRIRGLEKAKDEWRERALKAEAQSEVNRRLLDQHIERMKEAKA